jgi:phage terminase Nu1 subunit (DNA packaging protein)
MKTTPGRTIAALAGITTRRLRQLADQGHIPKAERGQYRTAETLRRLFVYFREHRGDAKAQRLAQQTRRDKAQADLLELQRRKTEGELVMMDEAKAVIRQYLGPMRDILTTAPMALAARVNPADPELARMQLETWSEDNMRKLREI